VLGVDVGVWVEEGRLDLGVFFGLFRAILSVDVECSREAGTECGWEVGGRSQQPTAGLNAPRDFPRVELQDRWSRKWPPGLLKFAPSRVSAAPLELL
jgi:hypothetical protein